MNSSRHSSTAQESPRCQVEEALSILQQLPLFRHASLDILKLYAYLSKKEEFPAGTMVITQGDPNDKMYMIIAGQVSIHEEHLGKSYRMQDLSAAGINYFGELALLGRFDWFFSARAETDVTLLSVSREAFQKVMERFPQDYTKTVEKIISLRVDRYVDQTRQLIEKTAPLAWEEKQE